MTTGPSPNRWLNLFAAALFLTACAPAPRTAVMGPSGILPILDASTDLQKSVAEGEILISGPIGGDALVITRHLGVDAISIRPARDGFAVGKSVDSLMINTPYVEWTWSNSPGIDFGSPIVIAIGLADPRDDHRRADLAYAAYGIELPAVDYLVAVEQAESHADSPTIRTTDVLNVGHYLPPRGVRLSGQWLRDGVDLESVVRTLWPTAGVYSLHVRYIVVMVPAGAVGSAMLGELSLHR